ncbi:MAG: hypothetical protein AAFU79_14150 [Myxococcota bacterium]
MGSAVGLLGVAAALLSGCGPPSSRFADGVVDVTEVRSRLMRHAFRERHLPTRRADRVVGSVENTAFAALPNLKRVDQLEFDLDFGAVARVLYFVPSIGNDGLVVHNLGHWAEPSSSLDVIGYWLDQGRAVLIHTMPFYSPNTTDLTLEDGGSQIALNGNHDSLEAAEDAGLNTFPLFFEPLARALNEVLAENRHEPIVMTGLSGGGWTTDIYSALDPRIEASYSIAGSLPVALRDNRPRSQGGVDSWDFEQKPDRPIFGVATYEDFYFLSALGDGQRHRQVLLEFDDCCYRWSGRNEGIRTYETRVQQRLLSQDDGGDFRIIYMPDETTHRVSTATLDAISEDLEFDPS